MADNIMKLQYRCSRCESYLLRTEPLFVDCPPAAELVEVVCPECMSPTERREDQARFHSWMKQMGLLTT